METVLLKRALKGPPWNAFATDCQQAKIKGIVPKKPDAGQLLRAKKIGVMPEAIRTVWVLWEGYCIKGDQEDEYETAVRTGKQSIARGMLHDHFLKPLGQESFRLEDFFCDEHWNVYQRNHKGG